MNELVDGMNIKNGDIVMDCTFGRGGHARALLAAVGREGRVYAFDRDSDAISYGKTEFAKEIESQNLVLEKSEFSKIKEFAERNGLMGKVNAVCADIGVSSPQLDIAERGFSFMKNGPLDMRMDQAQKLSAATVINEYSAEELADIFFHFGEEPRARFYAKKIVERRASKLFEDTHDLAEFIKKNSPYGASKKHPATKVFQGLRIYINEELTELKVFINSAFDVLAEKGRLGIIAFHSLEDRIVKNSFRELAGQSAATKEERFFRHLPVQPTITAKASLIKPFPLVPSDEEQESNPRSRSAKLRILEKNTLA
ncbi:MAG: 16S rRNA (cytosine(1402)-N(4))-methyltransferase RsmH [Oligoflexales bacterium]|nr:16S rRNA (cytosine(1402)-N(4))-methyltransferase RsmH [Oligoflexales bacterium]